jgi:hypothetical protein
VFSNTTSAAEWNTNLPDKSDPVVPKEYLASRLVDITRHVVNAECIMIAETDTWPNGRKDIEGNANEVFKEARFLGLKSTEKQAARLYHYSRDEEKKDPDIESAAKELSTRLDEDLEGFTLFYVPADKLVYYQKTDLFGDEFKANFPTANAEIIEAGNCFAFDRFTACAFHLMRSLEVVLKALFSTLGLPPLTSAGARNWNGILREIRAKLDSDKTIPDWDFYDSAYAFLAAAKNPMRNATMHVDAVYDEPSVSRVFDAVGGFMRHIATKLKEAP